MKPRLKSDRIRLLPGGLTVVFFAAVLLSGSYGEPKPEAGPPPRVVAPRRDCPMFGFDGSRNQVNTVDKNVPVSWRVEPPLQNIKWSTALGSRSYGAVVVSSGKIFTGSNNQRPRNPRDRGQPTDDYPTGPPIDKCVLMCFDEETGRFLWQAVHDKLESGQVNDWPQEGLPSMPAVEGNRLYYVSNRCELICADTEGFLDGENDGVQNEKYKTKIDADIVWRLDMMNQLNVFPHNLSICAPLIIGDLVFAVTANGVDENHLKLASPEAPSFIAVHKTTGKLVWQSNLPGKKVMHGQWSNPTYGEGGGVKQVIFPGGDGWLYGFDPPTGKLLWKFDCNPKGAVYELGGKGTKSDFIATPVVYEGRVYIATGQDPEHFDGVGRLWCIDLARAVQKGRVNKDNDVSPVDDVFDPEAEKNKERSALVWHFGGNDSRPKARRDFLFGRTMSTCAIHDGLVYIGEIAGYLSCLDARTGQRYWMHDTKSAIWGSAYYVDSKVYVPTEDGEVFVFAHGKEKKLLSKVEMEQAIRGSVVVVNGVMFIKSESVLYAIRNDP